MLLKLSSLILVMLLSGCTTTPTQPVKVPLILSWPTPMEICEITTVRINQDGEVILSYQDNINIAVCERDMFRYIKDLSTIICKHQPNDINCKDK